MNTPLCDDTLRFAARRLSAQLALCLPPADALPPALEDDLSALSRRTARRASARRLGRRVAAAALTALLTLGAVLATSPAARAAVSRWFLELTQLASVYRIAPSDAAPVRRTPARLPVGYTPAADLTGEDGIRILRYTSPRGDLLLQGIPLTGGVSLTAELRGPDTAGLTYADGTRPTGKPGVPADYDAEGAAVHGLPARYYTFPPDLPAGQTFTLLFYREGESVNFHAVSLSPGASALIWVDEDSNCMYLLTGGLSRQALLDTAESMYPSTERS